MSLSVKTDESDLVVTLENGCEYVMEDLGEAALEAYDTLCEFIETAYEDGAGRR